MESLQPEGPNAEQIRYWNEVAGPKWVALHEQIDVQIRPLGHMTMDRARLAPGERVIDVGCGCGNTTLDLARRVGPTGKALGIDLSTMMLARARETAAAAGAANVEFRQADAQTHPFEAGSFDVVFSRFGVMFFADATAAFRNLLGALRPGGRLAFVCWQALSENPWMLVPLAAALPHLPPIPLPDPNGPGPFGFADQNRVRLFLEGAGFRDVGFESVNEAIDVGGKADLDQVVDFALQMGPLGAVLRKSEPAARDSVFAAVRDAIKPYQTADGIRMSSAAWIVTGRRE